MDAVNLYPLCDEIPASEPRSPSSPSLLWYTWCCVVFNIRYFDMDVVHLVHTSVYQSVTQSIGQNIDHVIGWYVSSLYLIWTKSTEHAISSIIPTNQPEIPTNRKYSIIWYLLFQFSDLPFNQVIAHHSNTWLDTIHHPSFHFHALIFYISIPIITSLALSYHSNLSF